MIVDKMVTIAAGKDDFMLIVVEDGAKKEVQLFRHELERIKELCEYWLNQKTGSDQ